MLSLIFIHFVCEKKTFQNHYFFYLAHAMDNYARRAANTVFRFCYTTRQFCVTHIFDGIRF